MEELAIITKRVISEFVAVKYNRHIMRFLKRQIETVHRIANKPQIISESDAKHVLESLKPWLACCENMIKQHTQPFDLEKFYSVNEAKWLVETSCHCFWESLQWSSMTIKHEIPQKAVREDRSFLNCHLSILLGDSNCNLDEQSLQGWHDLKREFTKQLEHINIITDADIDWDGKREIGRGWFCVVYEARWKGTKVAVKKLKEERCLNGKYECLSQFCVKAIVNASMRHQNIVQSHGMSKFGLLVMERADENLKKWYSHGWVSDWNLKIRMLLQAASGLCHLHAKNIIYRNVKSRNMLVFHNPSSKCPTVKLCELSIAAEQSEEWNAEIIKKLQPWKKRYCAPEIDEGQCHSVESDVFSFGVVMCELAAQMTPYGMCEGIAILKKKLSQEAPCTLPLSCPMAFKMLMLECLSLNARKRPSMQDIEKRLQQMSAPC